VAFASHFGRCIALRLTEQSQSMHLLDGMAVSDHEQVIAFQNRATGLRGFLAIHDTTLGPALGGMRIRPYATEEDALADALRLSRAMTYKAALADLPCGGGKAVIIEHAAMDRPGAFEDFGVLVESLRGRFFTGRDVGIRDDDLAAVRRSTPYVAVESAPELGDISEHTAIGLWHGLRACLEHVGIARPRVAIQGAGSVGAWLARILKNEGADLFLADIDPVRAQAVAAETGARVISPDDILFADCDVLAPCALGGVLDARSIPRLCARIVCGSANNILAAEEDAARLQDRGILYAPDYLVNAGGLIRGAEFHLLGVRDSHPSLARIYQRMHKVLAIAAERRVSTARAADELAEARWKRPLDRPKRFSELTWSTPPRNSGVHTNEIPSQT
jgi:leucine dehydrogenase